MEWGKLDTESLQLHALKVMLLFGSILWPKYGNHMNVQTELQKFVQVRQFKNKNGSCVCSSLFVVQTTVQ